MFFESGGEDWFYRKRTAAEDDTLRKRAEVSRAEKRARMEAWVEPLVLVAAVEVKMEGILDDIRSTKAEPGTDGHVEADDKEKVGSDAAAVDGVDDVPGVSVNGIKPSEHVDMGISV